MWRSTWLWLHTFYRFYRSSAERRREDRESLCEAGAVFLLGTFCCDRHGNTKCPKQIKRFAISQRICFLNIYTVIKRVGTFTCEACAALFGALTGGEDDPWPKVYEHAASWRRFRDSYMRCRLYYLICCWAFNLHWTPHVNQLSLCLLESSVWWENITFPHGHRKWWHVKVKCAASFS